MENLPQSQCFAVYWKLLFSFSGGWPLRLDPGLESIWSMTLFPKTLHIMKAGWKQQSCCLGKHNASHEDPPLFSDMFSEWGFDHYIWDWKTYFTFGDLRLNIWEISMPLPSCLCPHISQFHGHTSLPFGNLVPPSLPLYSDHDCSSGGPHHPFPRLHSTLVTAHL